MVEVSLINPPIGTQLKGINAAGLSEPLGLLYIAAVLERRGIEVAVLDGAAEKMWWMK